MTEINLEFAMNDIIQKMKDDKNLSKKIRILCDIELYENIKLPDDAEGKMKYNIDGVAFARDASGGEYILLSDNSIGFISSEGECGRIAENMKDMFILLINVSSFFNYLCPDIYKDKDFLKRYSRQIEKENKESFNKNTSEDYDFLKKEIAEVIGVDIYENIDENILLSFYKAATREPMYRYTFAEENGESFTSDDFLSRDMQKWMKDKANKQK